MPRPMSERGRLAVNEFFVNHFALCLPKHLLVIPGFVFVGYDPILILSRHSRTHQGLGLRTKPVSAGYGALQCP